MARHPSRAKLAAAIVGVVLSAGTGLFLHEFPFGRTFTNLSCDLMLVARGDQLTEKAVLVYLDEKSHLDLGQSFTKPWDRALHARLLHRLKASGAKAVVFDVVFSDPNPTDPEADALLAEAIRDHGKVVLAADRIVMAPGRYEAVLPFEQLLNACAGVGSAEVLPERDLIVRMHTPEEELPSLAWTAAEVVGGVTTNDHLSAGPRWINYYGPPNWLQSVSYVDALNPERVPDDLFRDKTVFVGARLVTKFAGERKDEYLNPYSHWISQDMAKERGGLFISGVEIQATMFLNLIRGDSLRRMSPNTERFLLALAGILVGWGLIQLRPPIATIVALGGMGLVTICFFAIFKSRFLWFPWLFIGVQVVVALAWSVIYNSLQLYVQKRLYESTLALYLSPKLVEKFSGNPALLKPGAEKQVLTFLFSDIEDFTRLSEGMDSDELALLMNTYFESAVSQCIHRTDGTVVKYIGDAIFAFWSAPEYQPDHALRACQAALHFRELQAGPIHGVQLRTRIGLHTGVANVGNFGSTQRVDYTALGENVNLASRMEGLNKFLKTTCLMSGETRAAVGEQMLTRRLGRFRLKGFERAVEVHELVGRPEEAHLSKEWRECFEAALQAYRNGEFATAERGFRRTIELRLEDGPSSFYIHHMLGMQGTSLPANWSEDVELSEK